jgi:hypothetical protein
MTVDDTPHRVIINDLEAEIAQIEADEAVDAATVFLPDIDKKVSAIPQRLLQHRAEASLPASNTALVLYREPVSITVPEEDDVVRKTIIAARARAREKAVEDQRDRDKARERFLQEYRGREHDVDLDDAMTDHSSHADEDLDAMEIE